MRTRLILAAILLVGLTAGAQAFFGGPVNGNDTGGIIAWSPPAEHAARHIAADHCAGYGKYARITGVVRRYGDYISFNCLWRPGIARYAIPEVRVRHSRSVILMRRY